MEMEIYTLRGRMVQVIIWQQQGLIAWSICMTAMDKLRNGLDYKGIQKNLIAPKLLVLYFLSPQLMQWFCLGPRWRYVSYYLSIFTINFVGRKC